MGYMGYYHEARQIILQKLLTSGKIEIGCIGDASEVQRDIQLGELRQVAICGKLYNQDHQPICGEIIKVVKRCYYGNKELLEVIAYTKTDVRGEYRVVACGKEDESFYVLVEGEKCEIKRCASCNDGMHNNRQYQGRPYNSIGQSYNNVCGCRETAYIRGNVNYSPCNRGCYLSGKAISGYVNFS